MRTRSLLLAGLTAMTLIATAARADVSLPAVFSDHMVLQRDREIRVWGLATPGRKVTVRFRGSSRSTAADAEGRFEILLPASRAGGPHILSLRSSSGPKLTFSDVLVGDVWLCSGQSNMAWPVVRATNGQAEVDRGDVPGLRLLTVPRHATPEPQEDFKGSWKRAEPGSVRTFSAVAFFFGRELRRRVKVPIGLIHSSVGGTPAEAWTPLAALKRCEGLEPLLERWRKRLDDTGDKKAPLSPHRPGNLYHGMIHPLVGFGLCGAIWYQGESNASRAEEYRTLFPLMIQSWRELWGQGEFPFYFVQLANFRARKPEPAPSQWAELRDAQLHTLKTVPNTGMAVAIDIGEANDIHPKNKQEVGARLARWALAEVYGKDTAVSGPLYSSVEFRGAEAVLSFEHTKGGLKTATSGELRGFSIAGDDGKFRWAKARIHKDTVIVSHPEIPTPKAVRYAWADNPDCNLVNGKGLPASPFRTDDP